MNNQIVEILVDKALTDLKNLEIEAKNRGLESQLGRWIESYMIGLQKTNKETHQQVKIVLEKVRG